MSILSTKNGSNRKLERMKKELTNPKSWVALNLLVDSELHKAFKIKTATENRSMTEVIVAAIEIYISDAGKV